jgi:hypothetical protein
VVFHGGVSANKKLLNVTNLFAGTVKVLDLPMLLIGLLKLGAGNARRSVSIRMKI